VYGGCFSLGARSYFTVVQYVHVSKVQFEL
jgi:hypothetical protein